MSRKVTFYADGSNTSKSARNYLFAKGIEFEEVDGTTAEGHARLIKRTRQNRLPCIEVRGSGIHISSGFDEFLYASTLDPTLSYDRFVAMKGTPEEDQT
jgi:glutaredoxin